MTLSSNIDLVSQADAAEQQDPGAWPAARYAWYVVVTLIAAYTLSHVDRHILNLVIEPIRGEFGISDTKVSLLSGTAFAVFYVVMGIPFGWLADHTHRLRLICFGLVGWSVTTALCGFAETYGQLFLARVGVGIGEAALSPAALSVIADSFSPKRRAPPLGLYMLALAIGPGVAFLFGGATLSWLEARGGITVPIVGHMEAWRALFVLVSLPSLPVLLLLLTLREPTRRDLHLGSPAQRVERGMSHVMKFMFQDHRASFAAILLAWGGIALGNAILMIWTPTLFVRAFGWSTGDIGLALGLVMLIAGSIGVIAGPRLVIRFERAGHDDAYMRAAYVLTMLLTPLSIIAPLMLDPILVLIFLAPSIALGFALGALIPGVLQAFTPNRLRGQVGAVFSFCNNVIAMALGPTLVALATDYLFGRPSALPYSMALIAALCLPLSALLLRWGMRPFGRDVAAARSRSEAVR